MPDPDDIRLSVGETYQGLAFASDALSGWDFRNCTFVRCDFIGTSADVNFEQCRFEDCIFDDSGFEGAMFLGCTLEGNTFRRSIFDDVTFTDSNLTNCSFQGSSLFGSMITRSELSGLRLLDCEASFLTIAYCSVVSVEFDDSNLAGADLRFASGLSYDQIESAEGDKATMLPDGIALPSAWIGEDEEDSAKEEVDVAQLAAPLRVLWKESRLVQDPRGGVTDRFRDPTVLTVYRALLADVAAFLASKPTDHPITDRVRLIDDALDRGIAATNPVLVGFHSEVLRAQLSQVRGDLSESTNAQIEGILVGCSLFVAQFEAWREVADNSDIVDRERGSTIEVAKAIAGLAQSVRAATDLFDKRIADSLDMQAADLRAMESNAKIAKSSTNSANNVASALSARLWRLIRGGSAKVGDEALKVAIREFIEDNKSRLLTIVSWAPRALAWLKYFLEKIV